MSAGTKGDVADRLGVRYLAGPAEAEVTFTFVTLLARQDRYDRMLTSAEAKGFHTGNSQFLAIDNRRGNNFDGYGAIRRALPEAKGRYIVFTHDDVEFVADGAEHAAPRASYWRSRSGCWPAMPAASPTGRTRATCAIRTTPRSGSLSRRWWNRSTRTSSSCGATIRW